MSVVGARPQFIKAAALSGALSKSAVLTHTLVHTGQHYDYETSQIFFDELNIQAPTYNLEVGSGRHCYQMGHILLKLDTIVEIKRPDMILVYGDTNTTAAAAIVAAKNNIYMGHVEAGLREFNKRIPEEVNKLLTDAVADLYFCPTPTGVKNLRSAGIKKNVFLTGDVGLDLLAANMDRIAAQTDVLDKYGLTPKSYIFATCHRAANTGDAKPLSEILSALSELDMPVIFPLHPRTKAAIAAYGLQPLIGPQVRLTPSLGFWETQTLVHSAKMVMTDSGGLIKEAYFHRVPCIILDRQTEWVEIVRQGWAKIAGPDREKIIRAFKAFKMPAGPQRPVFGEGSASEKIADLIEAFLENTAAHV